MNKNKETTEKNQNFQKNYGKFLKKQNFKKNMEKLWKSKIFKKNMEKLWKSKISKKYGKFCLEAFGKAKFFQNFFEILDFKISHNFFG